MPSNSLRTFLERTTAAYAESLQTSTDAAAAAEYLTIRRGLSKANVKYFRLGFVANPLPGHELYAGKLSIPYITRSGVVSIRFRGVPPREDVQSTQQRPGGQKYFSVAGDMPRIYNARDLERRDPIVCICEGEFDAMTAHATSGLPAVGIAGVNGWRPFFARCFDGYSSVLVLCDNDDVGQGKAFGEKVVAQIPNARMVLMPPGHDVNSLVHAEGADALRSRLEVKNP